LQSVKRTTENVKVSENLDDTRWNMSDAEEPWIDICGLL
jgi:hypothetical protein